MKRLPGLYHDVSLSDMTTWHVGGCAQALFIPGSLDHLLEFLALEKPSNPIWLGLGSNVLISDEGVPSLVIASRFGLNQMKVCSDGRLYAQAGVTCAKFARFCVEHGHPQGAFFAGIPGTIGGALAMNAGAFGGQTWEGVHSVDVLNEDYLCVHRDADDFKASYRHIQGPLGHGFLAGYFEFKSISENEPASLSIAELLKKRNATQPIGTFNCGSVFKNPPGDHAARLIESCGLKGRRIGGAHVSMKHANFIINDQDATANDIISLMRTVQAVVLAHHGIQLETEVRLLGSFEENL